VATDEDALLPALVHLRDSARSALDRAEDEANDRLDQVLSEGDKPVVRKLALGLSNREIRTEAELDALLWGVPEHTVLCTHGEVLERLFEGEVACEKGGFWIVERRFGRLVPLRYVAPPAAPVGRLVGAGSLAAR